MVANLVAEDIPHNRRPTLGFFIEGAAGEGDYQNLLWSGIVETAREHHVNLLCFVGGNLKGNLVSPFQTQRNILYGLAGAESIDGLIISATIGNFLTKAEFQEFCHRYDPLPIVGVAMTQHELPTIAVDNRSGMREAVAHLIEVHQYRRIAFISGSAGNEEAAERHQAYIDTLAEYGLAFDPDLVVTGNFLFSSGQQAVQILLEERKVAFDAMIAANDEMAFGAWEALQKKGLRIPDDVPIIGFDDTRKARASTPALTTVRQPIRKLGRQAAEMLLAILRGETVPSDILLPTELVVRQSCGCLGISAEVSGASIQSDESLAVDVTTRRSQIIAEMVEAVEDSLAGMDQSQMGQLFDAFVSDSTGKTQNTFLFSLVNLLHQTMEIGQHAVAWQEVISVLRRNTRHLDQNTLAVAEDLYQQARQIIGDTAWRTQAYRSLQAEWQMQLLRTISQALVTTFDVNELMRLLTESLPLLDIPSAHLVLYEDPPVFEYLQPAAEWSQLMLTYDQHSQTDSSPLHRRFKTHQLVPENILPHNRQYLMFVEPLFFRDRQFGFMLFEIGPSEGTIYEILRGEVSSALEVCLLMREHQQTQAELQEAYAKVEKQVADRTAELQHEIARREQLQQEIIESQHQVIQELSAPVIPVTDHIIVMPLIGSIDSMRARDITRTLLAGITRYQAKVVILDITGVPLIDSGVANHLNKTVQAAHLKGTQTIITGISEAVAETIVDLGIDWSTTVTLSDLQTGLRAALARVGLQITRYH